MNCFPGIPTFPSDKNKYIFPKITMLKIGFYGLELSAFGI